MTDLVDRMERLSQSERVELAKMVAAKQAAKVWFCPNPLCDGLPHEGVEYNHARASQRPPALSDNSWHTWLIRPGRGWGKSACASHTIRAWSKYARNGALVGQKFDDVRQYQVEGESGLIRAFEDAGMRVKWQPGLKKLTVENGLVLQCYSAEEPESLRGPNIDLIWYDEAAHFPDWDALKSNGDLMLRKMMGPFQPRSIITTTPLPLQWLEDLSNHPKVVVTTGNTFENEANLAPGYLERMREKVGTRNGRQELFGEILLDMPGALWQGDMFSAPDFYVDAPDDLDRIVVAVDPAGSSNKRSDETGIVVVGVKGKTFYVLEDASGKYSPEGWARKAIALAKKWGHGVIVAEKNYGGEMVASTIRLFDEGVRVLTRHAVKSKQTRAEPLVGQYELGRVRHVRGLAALEKEQVTWVPGSGKSPNRIDALVWAYTELQKNSSTVRVASALNVLGRR